MVIGKTEINSINKKNSEFWSELCGTFQAEALGINDDSKESLAVFDDWYFKYYPYLLNRYIPLQSFKNKKVLEIGLGYGSVSQKIMESKAKYHGLDISSGPVNFVEHRANLIRAKIKTAIGSAHDIPYPDNYFDALVSIGCLHHTGDLNLAIQEVKRVVKPGGGIYLMLYSSHSHRQLFSSPREWIKNLFYFKSQFIEKNIRADQRARYDADTKKNIAPHVSLTSNKEIFSLLHDFKKVNVFSENGDLDIFINQWINHYYRKILRKDRSKPEILASNLKVRKYTLPLMRIKGIGTDSYIVATK